MMNRTLLGMVLAQLGLVRTDAIGRADAGETAGFARSLEHVRKQAYEVKYEELAARDWIPFSSDIPAGAQTVTWRIWDRVGMAKIISDFATDLPQVDLFGREESTGIRTGGVAYSYSTQDLRAAAMQGIPLDATKASIARRAYELLVENLCAVGSVAHGLPGMLNNANVPLVLPADSVYVGGWSAASDPDDMLNDLHYVANKVAKTTKRMYIPETLLLAPSMYDLVATKRLGELSETTVLEAFQRTNPYIRTIGQWGYLETADVAGTGPRGVVYKKDLEVLEGIEPLPWTQHPPQAKDLRFNVPTEGRIGGCVIRQPLAMVYFDNA